MFRLGALHPHTFSSPLVQYASDSALGRFRRPAAHVKPAHGRSVRNAMLAIPLLDVMGCISSFVGVELLASPAPAARLAAILAIF